MRILIKIGSSLLSKNNRLNLELLRLKVKEVSKLFSEGHEIIIVSSGAVVSGMEIENLKERPKDTLKLQLLSGEGQILLMKAYKELFDKENIKIAQVLLTHHNLDTDKEGKTITRIINAYLKQKVIPIINENDLINKEELDNNYLFTDNDILAAIIANKLDVNLTVILTDVDGLFDSNPRLNKNPRLIEEVNEINERIKKIASSETNNLGKGGMYSKVLAAEMMKTKNIKVIVANGNLNLSDIINNKVKRTIFK